MKYPPQGKKKKINQEMKRVHMQKQNKCPLYP